jgi:hypothetical protein
MKEIKPGYQSRREFIINAGKEAAKYGAALGTVGFVLYEVYRNSQQPPVQESLARLTPTKNAENTDISTTTPIPIVPSTNTPYSPDSSTPVPLAERFKLAKFDPSTTPFSVETSSQLTENLGYIPWLTKSLWYKVTKPQRIDTPNVTPELQGIFDGTAVDNSWGNPGATTITDIRNIDAELVHSMEPGAPGELCRIIGSFIIKHPDKINTILGQQVVITPDGANPIVSTIADIQNVPADTFAVIGAPGAFWQVDEGYNVLYFDTKNAGTPETIRTDKAPGVHYLILCSCTPGDGDFWIDPTISKDQRSYHNTLNRTMLTLRFTA